MLYENTLACARQLDEMDALRHFRKEFIIPAINEIEHIYFLGNSLGLQPKRTAAYLQQVLDQWSRWGVEGFFTGEQPWLHYHDALISPLANLVGALPEEVVVMNQLTVNLHLMLVSFYRPVGKRNKILCEAKAFPSDQYLLHSHVRSRGLQPEEVIIEVTPPHKETLIRQEDILKTIEQHREELALVLWGGVNYYTGQVFDMQSITEAAQKAGAKVGFDLAHAAGNVFLQLHDWNVDFACWCSYKYLNAGPGAIAGSFVHQRYHHDTSLDRFAGWWGNKKSTRFLMHKDFEPTPTAEGWQLSTPAPLLYAAHKASLEIFAEAGFHRCLSKAKQLSNYLLFVLNDINQRLHHPINIITPQNENEKGCQVSMRIMKNGKKIFDFLQQQGVFADWREPDVIRVAPVPLYNTFEEVWLFGQKLEQALIAVKSRVGHLMKH